MWPFSKKTTIAQSGLLAGVTDHHSHILPGVDDGAESMEESLRILTTYETAGVKELWLTPHIMEDIPNTPEKLKARFAELEAAYTGNIKLHLAAEYMIDNNFRRLLSNEGEKGNIIPRLLPIGNKGNHLLVETSYYNPPIRLHETLRKIKSLGYHPLLAHPERYMYMDNNQYRTLHQSGVKMQLNILSISGAYGRAVQKKAAWLLKNNMYTVAGSDLHSTDALDIINATPIDKELCSALQELLHTNL